MKMENRKQKASFRMTRVFFRDSFLEQSRLNGSEQCRFFFGEYCAEVEDYVVVFDAGDYWN